MGKRGFGEYIPIYIPALVRAISTGPSSYDQKTYVFIYLLLGMYVATGYHACLSNQISRDSGSFFRCYKKE